MTHLIFSLSTHFLFLPLPPGFHVPAINQTSPQLQGNGGLGFVRSQTEGFKISVYGYTVYRANSESIRLN